MCMCVVYNDRPTEHIKGDEAEKKRPENQTKLNFRFHNTIISAIYPQQLEIVVDRQRGFWSRPVWCWIERNSLYLYERSCDECIVRFISEIRHRPFWAEFISIQRGRLGLDPMMLVWLRETWTLLLTSYCIQTASNVCHRKQKSNLTSNRNRGAERLKICCQKSLQDIRIQFRIGIRFVPFCGLDTCWRLRWYWSSSTHRHSEPLSLSAVLSL